MRLTILITAAICASVNAGIATAATPHTFTAGFAATGAAFCGLVTVLVAADIFIERH